MATIASLSVRTNRSEYSRFELDKSKIIATVTPTPALSIDTEEITVELRKARRDRDVVVSTQTYTFTGTTLVPGKAVIIFDLNSLMEDESGDNSKMYAKFNKLRRGQYFIHAYRTLTPAIKADSPDFKLSIITAERLKKKYLFGLELSSLDIRKPKFQPKTITGVTVTEVSRGHALDFYQLTFNNAGTILPIPSLSWAGGPVVGLASEGSHILPNAKKTDYIIVEISDLSALPTVHTTEQLLIERDVINDASIQTWVDEATDWVEFTALQTFVEPTRIVTDIDGGAFKDLFENRDYDFNGQPLVLYPRKPGRWIDVQFPFSNLLKVVDLKGGVSVTKILNVREEWIEFTERTGFSQLIPFSQEFIFEFVGLLWVEALRGPVEVPNFWHYDIWTGLRDCPGEVQELIAKKAAIEVLLVAGQAFRSNIGSQTISRDGVTQAVSYINLGQGGGAYGGNIANYQNWIEQNKGALKAKYRGPNLWVL